MNFNLDLNAITTNALVIVPIIIAVVQAVKLTGWIKDHFSPLLAIGVGIIIAWLADTHGPSLGSTILTGAIYGLISSGLYSGISVTMKARARQREEQAKKQHKKELARNHKDKI